MAGSIAIADPMPNQAEAAVPPQADAVEGSIPELTRRLVRGDESAFSELHARLFDRVTRFTLMLTRGDESRTEEVVQATFLQLARRPRVFENEAALWSWLKVIARNTTLDLGRKQTRYESLLSRFSWQAPAVEAVQEHPATAALEDGLAALEDADRQLLEKKYLLGHSVRELAASAGTTEKAVEARLFRLRRELRDRMKQLMEWL